jgi:uncharacterized protein YjgD (DUF1641 family)
MHKEELKKLIVGRQKALEQKRHNWETLWQETADFIIPIREDILGTLQQGLKQGQRIYDGTAVGAAIVLTDGLHGHLLSPTTPWFKLLTGKPEVDSIREVRMWLEEIASLLYTAIGRSNFYEAVWMYLYDGVTIGTASLYAEEDEVNQRLVFEAVHPGECYIEENIFGRADIHHRKRKITARQAVEKFGFDNVPQAIRDQVKVDPFKDGEWIHAVFPRDDYDGRSLLATKKKTASVWYHCGSGEIVHESGYDDFPYAVWRFMKSGKSSYGRSPAMMALSDVKALNIISKTLLGAAQLAVDPMLNIPSEMKDKFQKKPGGLNHYSDPSRIVTPVHTSINFPAGIDREEKKQRIIEQHFHVDYFLMLARSEREMTAYEVLEKQGEKAAILGSVVGRLNSEAIDTIIDMVFNMEYRAGRLPPPPRVLLERAGDPIQIVYLGPLAQAQRRLFATQGIRSGIEAAAPIIQMFPESADAIDPLKTVQKLLTAHGFPAEAMNDEQIINAIRDARDKTKQQEMAMQAMMNIAPAVKDIANADKNTGGAITKAIKNVA